MSDSINNNITYILPQISQEISEKFIQLKSIIEITEDKILRSLDSNQEDFDVEIMNSLGSIKKLIHPYHILKQGYDFVGLIQNTIRATKNNEELIHSSFSFNDTQGIVRCVLDPYNTKGNKCCYYELRSDYRMDSVYNGEDKKAYIIVRDTISKIIEYNKIHGINIWMQQGDYENIDISFTHSDRVPVSKDKESLIK